MANFGQQFANAPIGLAPAASDDQIPSLLDSIVQLANELDVALTNVKTALTGECETQPAQNASIANNVMAQLSLIRATLSSAACSKNRICQKLGL